jgi:hypothetical protein
MLGSEWRLRRTVTVWPATEGGVIRTSLGKMATPKTTMVTEVLSPAEVKQSADFLAQSFSQSDCCDTAVDCAEPAACASGGTFRQIVQRPFNISGTTNRERASLRSMSINR